MKPTDLGQIWGGARYQALNRAEQQTCTVVDPHGHLPRWPRTLLTEQTSGLQKQEIHWQGDFLMTVSRPEPDFPPSNMR